jgi:hypothetical protein
MKMESNETLWNLFSKPARKKAKLPLSKLKL